MKSLIEWSVRNSPAVNTIMVAIIMLGVGSVAMLRREVFPEFKLEIVLVTVPYPGASPDEVEQGICQKIEEAIRTIEGIKDITSVAKEGAGSVVVELVADIKDPQRVLNEIRSAVDRIPSFPEQTEDPEIQQITFRTPAIRIGVMGGKREGLAGELELRELSEQVREELLQLPNVSQVELAAAKQYQIDVEIPEENLRKYNLTLRGVADILRRQNMELPAGNIKTDSGEYLVRGKNKSLVGADIAKIPILTQPNGAVLTVADLGHVRDGFNDETTISEVDGQPGIMMTVLKTSTEDIILISEAVHNYVKNKRMPEGYSLKVWGDFSVDVKQRISLLTRNGVSGLILVFLMLAAFLELRLAFWVAMGIPFSIMGTCVLMYFTGQTLNMLSMFAFVMALGIVVDDAIVIGDSVFEHRKMGKSRIQAAIDGTVEVAPSVASSVLTTVIAFIPLFFVSGVMGKFIAVMPFAIVSTLLISLMEATYMLPCHLAHGGETTKGPVAWFQKKVSNGTERFVTNVYTPVLRWSLDNPATIYATSFGLLLVSFGLIAGGFTPFVVFPKVDNQHLRAVILYPAGTPASITDAATKRIETAARDIEKEFAAKGQSFLVVSQRTVGYVSGEGDFRNDTGGQAGQVYLELVPSRETEHFQRRGDWSLARAGEFPGAEELTLPASRWAQAESRSSSKSCRATLANSRPPSRKPRRASPLIPASSISPMIPSPENGSSRSR
ncbi:MAG: efflux RND transporter permease subunit [Planctomycetota bacterium]